MSTGITVERALTAPGSVVFPTRAPDPAPAHSGSYPAGASNPTLPVRFFRRVDPLVSQQIFLIGRMIQTRHLCHTGASSRAAICSARRFRKASVAVHQVPAGVAVGRPFETSLRFSRVPRAPSRASPRAGHWTPRALHVVQGQRRRHQRVRSSSAQRIASGFVTNARRPHTN
jgi:hypothetical protein